MWDKSHGFIGQIQQNTFEQNHAENFFISIRQAGEQASGLSFSFLKLLDTFQPFGLLFQWNILYLSSWKNVYWIFNKYLIDFY